MRSSSPAAGRVYVSPAIGFRVSSASNMPMSLSKSAALGKPGVLGAFTASGADAVDRVEEADDGVSPSGDGADRIVSLAINGKTTVEPRLDLRDEPKDDEEDNEASYPGSSVTVVGREISEMVDEPMDLAGRINSNEPMDPNEPMDEPKAE